MKPEFVSDEEIAELDRRIDEEIANTILDMNSFRQNPAAQEVLRAGLWLTIELEKLGCNETLAVQFQYTFGQKSFGQEPWDVAQEMLNSYMNNTFTISEN